MRLTGDSSGSARESALVPFGIPYETETPTFTDIEALIGFTLFSPPLVDQNEVTSLARHSLSPWLESITPILDRLLERYLDRIHPLRRIIDASSVRQRFASRSHLYDTDFAALVLALAALAALSDDSVPTTDNQEETLISNAMTLHNRLTLGNAPNLETVATSMTVAAYAGARHGRSAAHIRTREAITLLQLLRLNAVSTYETLSEEQTEIGFTMLWLLSGIERSAALFDPRPLILRQRPSTVSAVVQDSSLLGLPPVLRVYDALETDILDCINALCSTNPCPLDAHGAVRAHRALETEDDGNGRWSLVQHADLRITRLWIHSKLWLASLTHSLLYPPTYELELSPNYPLTLLDAAEKVITTLPRAALYGNGQSLVGACKFDRWEKSC